MLTRRRGALAAAVCALGASVSAALASQPPSPSAAPPCAGCAVITLTPGQTLLAPAQLEGTALLLRVAPGTDARDWRASLDEITRRGGRGGLHLTGVPAEDDVTRASAVLHDVAALQMWLPSGLAPVPDRAVTCGSARLPTFMNPQTLDLIAVATACAANAPIVSDAPGAAIDRLDLADVRLV